jgi:hypothetical protein
MPQIGANNEPLLERAIFGYDGTNYRVVKVDTDGNLVAAIKASQTIEVIQDTAADLKATVNLAADQNVQARNYGFLGAAWQKQPLIWSYSSRLSERVSNTSAAAGQNTLNSSAIAAGYVAKIEAVEAFNDTTNPTLIRLAVIGGGNTQVLARVATPGISVPLLLAQTITLAAGDVMRAIFDGCALNDDIYLDIWGYQMKIND